MNGNRKQEAVSFSMVYYPITLHVVQPRSGDCTVCSHCSLHQTSTNFQSCFSGEKARVPIYTLINTR